MVFEKSAYTRRREIRDQIELLRRRMALLRGKDRVLLSMYLENGATFRQLARLSGVNEVTIARRIDRSLQRLKNWKYIAMLQKLGAPRRDVEIVREYLVAGLSQGRIAQKLGVSRYAVRTALARAQALTGCRLGPNSKKFRRGYAVADRRGDENTLAGRTDAEGGRGDAYIRAGYGAAAAAG